MKYSKDEEIKTRVTKKMRSDVEAIARERGEAVSLVVREALTEYLAKRIEKKPIEAVKKRSSG